MVNVQSKYEILFICTNLLDCLQLKMENGKSLNNDWLSNVDEANQNFNFNRMNLCICFKYNLNVLQSLVVSELFSNYKVSITIQTQKGKFNMVFNAYILDRLRFFFISFFFKHELFYLLSDLKPHTLLTFDICMQ